MPYAVNRAAFFTGALLLLSLIAFSTKVLDPALTPRYIVLSAALIVFIIASPGAFLIPGKALVAALICYTAVVCVSSVWAINKAEALFESGRALLFAAAFLCGLRFLSSSGNRLLLCKLTALAAGITMVAALLQLARLSSLDKESLYGVSGLNAHKNLLASFLFLCSVFIMQGYLSVQGNWRVIFMVVLVFAISVILLLRTKAVYIGSVAAVLGGISFPLVRRFSQTGLRGRWTFVICGLVLLNLAMFVLTPCAVSAAVGGKWQPDGERLVLWQKTLALIREHWLTGVGAGNWQVAFPNYGLDGLWRAEDLNYTFQRPHNDLLWMISETGVLGFNLFFSFVLLCLHQLLTGSLRTSSGKVLFGGICGYFVVAFFDFPHERIEHTLLLAMLLAWSASGATDMQSIELSKTKWIGAALLLLVLVTGGLRFAGEIHTRKLYDLRITNPSAAATEARKAQSFAYTLDPTSVPLHWYIGNAMAFEKNFSAARTDLLKAYHYNPYNRNVLNDLASALVVTGDTAEAVRLYGESSRISPRFDDPKLNLAAILIARKEYKAASDCLAAIMHNSAKRSNYQAFVDYKLANLPQH